MSGLYFSRARLKAKRGEALAALAPTLLSGSKGDTVGNAHRILWMLFEDRAESEKRDFLWREENPGRYLVLSRREPLNRDGLFDLETKVYDPQLAPGDRLQFSLRANAVVSHKTAGLSRGARSDIVMDALYALDGKKRTDGGESERAKARDALTREAAEKWMRAQGEKHGFRLVSNPAQDDKPFLAVTNYETIEIPRMKDGRLEPRKRYAKFGILDFSGLIEISDAEAFMKRLPEGFGKAKAFGCGLMLIKRAA